MALISRHAPLLRQALEIAAVARNYDVTAHPSEFLLHCGAAAGCGTNRVSAVVLRAAIPTMPTMLSDVTPMILTFNEAPNLRRTLEKLAWAKQTVVVDSFSTDETLEIARSFAQVSIVQREFDTFAGQCNFGLQKINTEWVLSLDADYVLSDELQLELGELRPGSDVIGYRAKFVYCMDGRPLRTSLYPPRTVLYRRTHASYRDQGHGHRVEVDGKVVELRSPIFHDDRKPLDRWLHEQNRYAVREAEYLFAAEGKTPEAGSKKRGPGGTPALNWRDRIRTKIVLAPILIFFYTLLGRGLVLDGWPGLYYVFQRTLAEMLLSLRLMEAKLRAAEHGK